jgi:hypothetical protein
MLRCNSVYESGESMLSSFACEGYDVRERETNRGEFVQGENCFQERWKEFWMEYRVAL